MSQPITDTGEVNAVVECAILCNGHILMQKRSQTVKHFKGFWTTPGGHIDDLENAAEAVIREVKEETGLDLKPEQIKMREFAINKHTNRNKIYIVSGFVAKLDQMLKPQGSSEGECEWLPIDTLDQYEIMEPVREFIKIALQDSDEVVHIAKEYNVSDIKSSENS